MLVQEHCIREREVAWYADTLTDISDRMGFSSQAFRAGELPEDAPSEAGQGFVVTS